MTDDVIKKLSEQANRNAVDVKAKADALLDELRANPHRIRVRAEQKRVDGRLVDQLYIEFRDIIKPELGSDASLDAFKKSFDALLKVSLAETKLSHKTSFPAEVMPGGSVRVRSNSSTVLTAIHKDIQGDQRKYVEHKLKKSADGVFFIAAYLADNGVNFQGSAQYRTPGLTRR